MDYQEWLAGLKPGDRVWIHGSCRMVRVERTTDTLIVLENGTKWTKKHGEPSPRSRYNRSYLEDPAKHERTHLHNIIRGAFHGFGDTKFTMDQLREVAKILGIEP
jgi:hypothetical protein